MKTTLVIGASSDIARTLISQLTETGENVIGISRQSPDISMSKFIQHDILSDQSLPEITDEIDGLVYCPGSITLKPFKSLKKDDFLNDLEINVFGAIKCLQAYLPLMKKSTNASVVLFSSVAVQSGMPYHSVVGISKGAIEGLTRALAAEYAPNVRFNCIAPSLTKTKMADKFVNTPEKETASGLRHPLKRIGTTNDIASTAIYLLSEQSSWTTGQIFHIDGGMSSLRL